MELNGQWTFCPPFHTCLHHTRPPHTCPPYTVFGCLLMFILLTCPESLHKRFHNHDDTWVQCLQNILYNQQNSLTAQNFHHHHWNRKRYHTCTEKLLCRRTSIMAALKMWQVVHQERWFTILLVWTRVGTYHLTPSSLRSLEPSVPGMMPPRAKLVHNAFIM